jgi:hypothetical protein
MIGVMIKIMTAITSANAMNMIVTVITTVAPTGIMKQESGRWPRITTMTVIEIIIVMQPNTIAVTGTSIGMR